MRNVIFISPPAAGKGTQAKMLCQKYGFVHISTGDLLRKAASENSDIQNILNLGKFIDDSIILELIDREIKALSGKEGYVLDGFPRNIIQAQSFDQMIQSFPNSSYVVIYINVSKEIASNRILGRVYCPECGASYNTLLLDNHPKIENVCDKCHSSLIKRNDDTPSTFEARFDAYIRHTEPLLEYYKKHHVLHTVDGNQDVIKVHENIIQILEGEL